MPALPMLYGGLRTANLLINGDMEARLLEAAAGAYYQSRFWTYADGDGWTGTLRNTTTEPHAGTYATEFNIVSTVYTPSDYPYAQMLQRIPLDDGVQAAQLGLLHFLQVFFYLEAGLGASVEVQVDVGLTYKDGTTEYRYTIPFGLLSTGAWKNISQWFTPSDYWTDTAMAAATDLVVKFYVRALGSSSGTAKLHVDDFHLGAEMEFDKQVGFPEDIERSRAGKSVRLGDSSRTMVQAFQAGGRSKRAGVLHFRLISATRKAQIEAVWAYAAQNYIWWIPRLTGYGNIALRPRDRFRFVAASPNLAAGYNGDLPWDEY